MCKSLQIAVAGVKYCNETGRLIKKKCDNIDVDLFCLGDGKYPRTHQDIYIITDRLCNGMYLKPDIYTETIKGIVENIRPCDIAIINIDDEDLIRHLQGLKCNIITYGYNSRASVTISGINNDVFTGESYYVCSLQRTIKTVNNKKIEPCEVRISVTEDYNPQSVMAYSAFLISSDRIN